MDATDVRSFRADLKPRYRLQERLVAGCLLKYMIANNRLLQFKSGYLPRHSVETAIDKVLGG